MIPDSINELYQQTILEHNKKPHNFKKLETATHQAEGYNPICGDHIWVYVKVDGNKIIQDISFHGSGCAISTAAASMMTTALKGKSLDEVKRMFEEYRQLVSGSLHPEQHAHHLGKLAVFSGIWQFPSRVKCAVLSWHTLLGALNNLQQVSSE